MIFVCLKEVEKSLAATNTELLFYKKYIIGNEAETEIFTKIYVNLYVYISLLYYKMID